MAVTGSYQDHQFEMFSDKLNDELQKKGSRLEQAVSIETMEGHKAHFDKLGKFSSYEKTTRNQHKNYQDAKFERRDVTFKMNTADIVLDIVDLKDLIANPQSDYVRNMAMELGRQKDTTIFNALSGSAVVVSNGSSSNTGLSSSYKIAVNDHTYDVVGGTNDIGLTEFKLKKALKLLGAAEVDVENEEIFVIAPQNQLMGLAMVTEVVNSQWREKKPLESGPGIDRALSGYLGLTFIRYEETGNVNTTDEVVYVFAKSAIKVGIRTPLTIKIAPDTTLVGNPDTISAIEELGAVRMYEEKVIQIACDPSTFVSA